ncbi:hypothetical protein [Xanthomonas albilineans]|uniref:hypothetical protein n=1 Tax=Xanthomonas albilineans TaxID=29447 RepID=UPI000ABAD543|nr:hypothetical protein [Xanthomonas albilineans]
MNTPTNAPTNEPSGIHLIGNIPVDAHGTVHIDTSKPIPFAEHAFGAACYDTYGCKVLYDGRYEAHDPDDVKQIAPRMASRIMPWSISKPSSRTR